MMFTAVKLVLDEAPAAERRRLWRGIAWTVAEGLAAAVPFLVLYRAVADAVTGPLDGLRILWVAGLMVAALAVQWFCGVRAGHEVHGAVYAMTAGLRLRLIAHLDRLPLGLFVTRRVGDLADAATDKVQLLEQMLTQALGQLVAMIAVPAVVLALVLAIDPLSALILALGPPAGLLASRWLERAFTGGAARRLALAAEAGALLVEHVQALKAIRIFAAGRAREGRVAAAFGRLRDLSIGVEMRAGIALGLFAVVTELAFVVLVAVDLERALSGGLGLAGFATLMILAMRWYDALTRAAVHRVQMLYMGRGAERVRDLLALAPMPVLPGPDRSTPGTSPPAPDLDPDIRFEGVSFGYDGPRGPMVLKDISLSVPAGGFVALVGPSGAGKSTLVELIARFHDVTAGRILLGGVDIRCLPPEALAARISMVFQDVWLFDLSIRDNIRLGRPDASDADVEAAARAAAAHDFILTLPEGYDTRAGEGGQRLSGGERQRISIARALLADAPVLLLDEATAALDAANAAAVQAGLDQLVRDRTLVVIAHNLASVTAADQIVVLDGGRIVERGRHDALLALGGRYAALWRAERAAEDQPAAASAVSGPGS
ncbi:ABC transporter ATP-binding protein [Tistrella mobilis]|uniref:ABC transporter ATP-binding protein n=1 Tax=Tistrella mobilis TaxID=171437 RepID=UPI003555F28C